MEDYHQNIYEHTICIHFPSWYCVSRLRKEISRKTHLKVNVLVEKLYLQYQNDMKFLNWKTRSLPAVVLCICQRAKAVFQPQDCALLTVTLDFSSIVVDTGFLLLHNRLFRIIDSSFVFSSKSKRLFFHVFYQGTLRTYSILSITRTPDKWDFC